MLTLGNLEIFQPYISKVAIAATAKTLKDLYGKNKSCNPVMLDGFPHKSF